MAGTQTVGVIGIGRMGLPMVRNLLEDGQDVSVYDQDADAREAGMDAGASVADSPRAVGEDADVVLLVLPTDDAAWAACTGEEGLFAGLDGGHLVLTNSSHPSLPGELQDAAPEDVTVVDAPMCRGVPAARSGDILFLVGGPDDAIETCRPVLEPCGELEVLGGLGAGQIGKTANNILLWITIVGDYEVFRLVDAVDVDIDPTRLRRALPKSSGDNWALRDGNWEGLRLTWPEKDLAIALDIADDADSTIPVSALTSQLIRDLDVPDLEPFYFPEYRDGRDGD